MLVGWITKLRNECADLELREEIWAEVTIRESVLTVIEMERNYHFNAEAMNWPMGSI